MSAAGEPQLTKIELDALRARRATLTGAKNKNARHKLNRLIKTLEDRGLRPESEPEPEPEPEPDVGTTATEAAMDHGVGGWHVPGNYLPASAPGCHVVHFDAPWIVGTAPFDGAQPNHHRRVAGRCKRQG
jgi:hypothetical protein